MHILGILIDNFTREEILAQVEKYLDEPKLHQIATVNPEFLLEAEKNQRFRTVLEQCDLCIADGFGISLAFLLKGEKLKCRFPGADLMKEILRIANEKNLSIYLAVRKDGLSSYQEVKDAILKNYLNLEINGDNIDIKEIQYSIFDIQDSIVLCNFGAPKQELFLQSLKNQNNIRLALGVGGSFDYLTGKLKRAPEWLCAVGLEWLWRLIQQPKRWKRIWNAVVVFPFRIIFATIEK